MEKKRAPETSRMFPKREQQHCYILIHGPAHSEKIGSDLPLCGTVNDISSALGAK